MSVKYVPAKLVIEIPAAESVTVPAYVLERVLQSKGAPADLNLLRGCLPAHRVVEIKEGVRVRLKVNPANREDFDWGFVGWDSDDVVVSAVDDSSIELSSPDNGDFTSYVGPLEKLLDVLEILDAEAPKADPAPDGWIAWDFSHEEGPDLPEGTMVHTRLRGGLESEIPETVEEWYWCDDASDCAIVAYKIAE